MKKYLYILMVGCMALGACSKEASVTVPESKEIAFAVEGEFSPSVETRATEVETSSLSTVYVTATTGTQETQKFLNQAFTKSGSTWTGGKYWEEPASGQNSVAYHFYLSNAQLTAGSGTAGPTIAPANANTDIVVDYLPSPAYKEVATAHMEHIFARFTDVTLKAPAGYKATNIKLSFLPITSGTFSLKQMDTYTVDASHPDVGWTTKGSASTTAAYLVGSASSGASINTAGGTYTNTNNDVWFVPGSYTLTLSYTLSTDNGDWSKAYTKTATVALQRGKKNKIVLNNNQPNIPDPGSDVTTVTFDLDVTPWNDNPLHPTF